MDAETQIKHIRELASKRQKKYLDDPEKAAKHAAANKASYEKRKIKKAAALAKAKEDEAKKEATKTKPKKKLIIRKKKEEEPDLTNEQIKELSDFADAFKERNKPKPQPKKTFVVIKTPYLMADLEKIIGEKIEAKKSQEVYLSSLKRIFKLFGESSLAKILKTKDLIQRITTTGKDRGVATVKADLQTLLKMITIIPLNVSDSLVKEIKLAWQAHKIKNDEVAAEKKYPAFDDYINNVENTFGKDSKQYVVSELYSELPTRDDMILKVVDSIKKTTDKKHNYLVLTASPKGRIVINHFKTEKGFDKLDESLSSRLTNILKKYMNSKNDKEYLFTASKLTQFVSNMNKKMGYAGGINLFRHMAVQRFLSTARTAEERVKYAERMKHSADTQLKYLLNKKVD